MRNPTLKLISDSDLENELKIRADLRRQQAIEALRGRDRIAALSENVARREREEQVRNAQVRQELYTRVLEKVCKDFFRTEDSIGEWAVYGGDNNFDMCGSHEQPFLCSIRGKLADVVRKAVDLRRFEGCAGPGYITPLDVLEA